MQGMRHGAIHVKSATWSGGREPGANLTVKLDSADRKMFRPFCNRQGDVTFGLHTDIDELSVPTARQFDWSNFGLVRRLGRLLDKLNQQAAQPLLRVAMPKHAPDMIRRLTQKFDATLEELAWEKVKRQNPLPEGRKELLEFVFSPD